MVSSMASAAIWGTAFSPSIATAATLDWNAVNYPVGSLSQSFTVGGGSVSLNFTGQTSALVGFGASSDTPDDNTVLNGSSTTEETLHLQADFSHENQAVTLTTNFTGFGQGVSNVAFLLYDIDIGTNWQDRVVLQGFLGNTLINPTFIGVNSTYVTASGNTLDGKKAVDNNSDLGNVTVAFNGIIDHFTLAFTQDPAKTPTNPASHGIALGDISFEPVPIPPASSAVPEPLTMAGVGLAIGFGGFFKRKRAKQST